MVGGTIRRKLIHRESFRASVLHLSEIQAVLQSIAANKFVLTTPSFLSSGTPHEASAPPRRVKSKKLGTKKEKSKPASLKTEGCDTPRPSVPLACTTGVLRIK